jgi:DNA polymerase sigma
LGGTLYDKENTVMSGFQNYLIFDNLAEDRFRCPVEDLHLFEDKFDKYCWKKVFDTKKIDYQYVIGNMKSRIQLQEIDNIGLVLYYDNPDYYDLEVDEQRNKLIDELNSYGFSFGYNDLGIDKLRTLYEGKFCFSKNQNG